MRRDPAAPVAVLSPHLDDAVLSAWSTLRGPAPVRVVDVCTAVPPSGPAPPWDRLTGATDAAERMYERLEEDERALAVAGCEAVALGFLDAQYRAEPIDPDALLRALVDAVPAARELWAPAGIGAHGDHVQVREAAFALADGGGPPVRLYAELPYAVKHGWPPWVTRRRDRTGLDYDAWWSAFLPGGEMPPATRHVLPRAEVRRKLLALAEYRTQWTALDGVRRQLSRRDVIRYEVSFEPSAAGGAPEAALERRGAAP